MAISTTPLDATNKVFAQGNAFWNNYLKGRPSVPSVFYDRIFAYHAAHSDNWSIVHDVGAGNGPCADTLRSKFSHVIVSDIAPDNVRFAENRLGTGGYSYRAASVEEADDIPAGSVDMVFATNVMHFCDQEAAMAAIARQLRPGGTFACAIFGAAQFADERVQQLYIKLGQIGARGLLKTVSDPDQMVQAMVRTGGTYNVAPMSPDLWQPGALRINLNMPPEGLTSPLPPEMYVELPACAGVNDVTISEDEEGWGFTTDLAGVREHVDSFPFGQDSSPEFAAVWQELEEAIGDKPVQGHWPAKIILATRQ